MSDPITLPGSIAGLLRRGAPVITRGVDRHPDLGGVVVDVGGRHAFVSFFDQRDRDAHSYHVHGYSWAAMSLDLRDPLGADIAARWLAERVDIGPSSHVTSPDWGRYSHCAGRGCLGVVWSIGVEVAPGQIDLHTFAAPGDCDDPAVDTRVPALASIDPADPDADLLALAAVCRFVAEVPRV